MTANESAKCALSRNVTAILILLDLTISSCDFKIMSVIRKILCAFVTPHALIVWLHGTA